MVMRGLVRRFMGGTSQEPAAPGFTLDLPVGWAGGYGDVSYMQALLDYGRAHPECHDSVFEQLRYPENSLYAAVTACSREAGMSVNADDVPEELPPANAIEAFAGSNLENLAS